tara:strand:+ start:1384 stop:1854 length:471 start_codon:yes stop_codon:yes gene_type:complete
MTTMPEEIFSDHIDDNEETVECNKSLSKMNKSELYQLSKRLVNENQKLQLFVNTSDELHKQNENTKLDMSKKIKELEKDNELKDEIISLHEQDLSRDDVEVEELKEKYDKLAEENEELKEKDKKAKEIFKLMGEWYEDNIIGHLPESEEEDEEENE